MKNNNAILLINLSGSLGGATKRYINLFNYLNSFSEDYYLLIDDILFERFKKFGLLKDSERILVLKISLKQDRRVLDETKIIKNDYEKLNGDLSNKLKAKTQIKLIFRWINFSRFFHNYQNKYKFKLIYSVFIAGNWVLPFKYIYGFKLIHSYNDNNFNNLKSTVFNYFNSEYHCLKYSDKIDFLSEILSKDIIKYVGRLDEKRISVTPNSFTDYSKFVPSRTKKKDIVFLSRLTSDKNPMLLLESLRILKEQKILPNDFTFYIYGEGYLESEIKKYIMANSLYFVEFKGLTKEPWKVLNESSIFLSLQSINNYPSQSLLEAMASGNAIIATDVGETRKLVDETMGYLVETSPEGLAIGLQKIFENKNKIKLFGENARAKALNEHSIQNFANYFLTLTN